MNTAIDSLALHQYTKTHEAIWIVVGVIMVITAVLGCVAMAMESRRALLVVAGLLALVMLTHAGLIASWNLGIEAAEDRAVMDVIRSYQGKL